MEYYKTLDNYGFAFLSKAVETWVSNKDSNDGYSYLIENDNDITIIKDNKNILSVSLKDSMGEKSRFTIYVTWHKDVVKLFEVSNFGFHNHIDKQKSDHKGYFNSNAAKNLSQHIEVTVKRYHDCLSALNKELNRRIEYTTVAFEKEKCFIKENADILNKYDLFGYCLSYTKDNAYELVVDDDDSYVSFVFATKNQLVRFLDLLVETENMSLK